ncbi:putative phospholipid-translocating P-type ATPase, partial [Fragilariopsis cylindrus CCMP1102]
DRVLTAGLPDYTRCDNTLITSKYTILNFLPLTIRGQFRRFANMYFLIVGIIMAIGTYFPSLFASAFSPFTTLGPLALFVSISLLMEGIADKKRHHNDYITNTYQFKVKVKFNYSQRKDIRQGHLIVIRNREMIPADTILLASSGDRGCAYIETSSIDGETNLKLRISAMSKHDKKLALHQSHESIEDAVLQEDHQTNENRNHLSSVLTTEPPDAHINTFSGKLTMPISVTATDNDGADGTDGGEIIPLGSDHLLLRGAVLRNTEWVIGIVSYTGTDTKLSQNSIDAPSKFSQLDLVTNKCVIVMIIVELICIIYLSTMATRSSESEPTASNLSPLWYLVVWPYLPELNPPKWEESGDNWIQYALTYITLLSYFVPLSMYFTLEIVNFFLMYLIYVDDDMYDETTNTIAEPRSTIVTDLGQIQYIFTDKTGTLTQNVMRFKRCSIGTGFGGVDSNGDGNGDGDGHPFHPTKQVLVGQIHINDSNNNGDVSTSDNGLHLETSKGMTFNAELFLRVMSLCHTVVNDEKSADGAPFGYAYQAESPDEGALVSEASKGFGFQVISRDSRGIKLKCDHPTFNIETWSVLAINKFDSTRKRMSILVRSPQEFGNVAILLCKGADSAMLDPEICTTITKMLGIESHLGEFASEGLRTLVLGVRFLTDKQCDEWMSSYTSAAASIKDRDTKLKLCASEIEKELHIVGATAIEDKLQKNVPKTIATLAKAGIKLWVLTGDKRETAIEIGYSTQVLTPQMHLTEVSDRGLEFKRTPLERIFAVDRDVRKGRLVKHLKKEKPALASSSPITPHAIVPSGDGPRALIIEGNALKHLQGDSELEELIFNIASQATSVIACRVTPAQKAQLVKLVRHHVVPEPVTLAIGDGANDVGMIHEAHVGIGISGKEGKQAVNASDFSIGQFRFLEDLILYHGRWDYMRTSTVVLYSFYKNFVIAGCLVLYNHETLFSGTSLFDQWLNSGFSFWAFFPILFLGMFDRNLEKSYIRKNPEVYKPTRQKELITARILSRWIFMAIAHV